MERTLTLLPNYYILLLLTALHPHLERLGEAWRDGIKDLEVPSIFIPPPNPLNSSLSRS